MAVYLSPRSILDRVHLPLSLVWGVFLFILQGFPADLKAFLRLLLLEYGGGPEKDRIVLCFGSGSTLSLLRFVRLTGSPWA